MVTRARPKTDRIACPWLVRRFIDPDSQFVYVPADAALVELARIVHAAGIAADVQAHPFGAASRAIGEAGVDMEADDQRLLERGLFVFDALDAWCQRQTGAGGR